MDVLRHRNRHTVGNSGRWRVLVEAGPLSPSLSPVSNGLTKGSNPYRDGC